MALDRRRFLQGGLALLAGGSATACRAPSPELHGELLGPDVALGHRFRDGSFPAATCERRVHTLIVGGGIAGLSAAWQLQREGHSDFTLIELENVPGGNARSGASAVSTYPWGAHYLPLPTREATSVVALLEDVGVVTGRAADGSPRYDERYLLAPPDERLFQYGLWRPGLKPLVPARSEAQFARFEALLADLRDRKTSDGRPAFTTPSAFSSQDPTLQALDSLSMAQWLEQHGFDDAALRWLVEYGCRDDFGTTLAGTSAWAGLHYHCGRRIWGDYADGMLLTWPAGNGWLVQRLRERLDPHIECGRAAVHIEQDPREVRVDVWTGRDVERIRAQRVILCTPGYISARLLPGVPSCSRQYNPWLVANLHVRRLPDERQNEMAWDNVIYDSPGLGYVCATHQTLQQHTGRSVLTYYLPFPDGGAGARKRLLEASWEEWARLILADLRTAHPDIDDIVERLDIWRWGHAMVAPTPGLLTSPALARARRPLGRVHFAHSDLSGFSLFEEAHHWGVTAARQILAAG